MFFKTLFGICLLRANPQDLPVSPAWMFGAIVAYAVMDVIGVLDVLTLSGALLAAAVDTFMLVGATQLVLRSRHLPNRIPQTLTALGGSGAILSFIAWALAALTPGLEQWIWGLFMLWYILVFGHVLRHSLSISLAMAVALSLLYLILSMSITGLFVNPVSTEH
ncbi:MAG: hypothetical protein HY081_03805 [Gammaproteobacteria bacterium]|nr:hypothetical protein [Gammaproteobacteria bacterium]